MSTSISKQLLYLSVIALLSLTSNQIKLDRRVRSNRISFLKHPNFGHTASQYNELEDFAKNKGEEVTKLREARKFENEKEYLVELQKMPTLKSLNSAKRFSFKLEGADQLNNEKEKDIQKVETTEKHELDRKKAETTSEGPVLEMLEIKNQELFNAEGLAEFNHWQHLLFMVIIALSVCYGGFLSMKGLVESMITKPETEAVSTETWESLKIYLEEGEEQEIGKV